jgi:ribosomal protein S17
MFDSAYISAIAALGGTFIGTVASITTTWLGQRHQSKEQRRARSKHARQAIYKKFIKEAARLHVHALEHDESDMSELVNIHATLNLMRVFATSKVIDEADKAIKEIIATYSEKNKTFHEVISSINQGFVNPLLAFSEACHEELEN